MRPPSVFIAMLLLLSWISPLRGGQQFTRSVLFRALKSGDSQVIAAVRLLQTKGILSSTSPEPHSRRASQTQGPGDEEARRKIRDGLRALYKGDNDAGIESVLDAYMTMSRAKYAAERDGWMRRVADGNTRLTVASKALKKAVYWHQRDRLGRGRVTYSLATLMALREDYISALDALREAILAAPPRCARDVTPYRVALSSAAGWAATNEVNGSPIIEDSMPYELVR